MSTRRADGSASTQWRASTLLSPGATPTLSRAVAACRTASESSSAISFRTAAVALMSTWCTPRSRHARARAALPRSTHMTTTAGRSPSMRATSPGSVASTRIARAASPERTTSPARAGSRPATITRAGYHEVSVRAATRPTAP